VRVLAVSILLVALVVSPIQQTLSFCYSVPQMTNNVYKAILTITIFH